MKVPEKELPPMLKMEVIEDEYTTQIFFNYILIFEASCKQMLLSSWSSSSINHHHHPSHDDDDHLGLEM